MSTDNEPPELRDSAELTMLPAAPEVSSVSGAAASGNELQLLYALRGRLAEAIEDCPVRDLSALTRRLQDVMKEISEREEVAKKEASNSGTNGRGEKWNPADDL